VALQNSRLLENIQALFEGFVNASVTAIESRDPTTSGHSFRVADLTVALAQAADRAESGPFGALRFTAEQMREIRYASLLHDFGKVGVREEVLIKAKKLYPSHLELIKQRLELIKRGVALRYGRQKLDAMLREDRARAVERVGAWDAELEVALGELDEHMKAIVSANEPTVMAEDVASRIQHLAVTTFLDHLGEPQTVITPEEAQILSIPRGSLTPRSSSRSSPTWCTPTSSWSRSPGPRSCVACPRLRAPITRSSMAPATRTASAPPRFPSSRR
jgi:hypothetical protein